MHFALVRVTLPAHSFCSSRILPTYCQQVHLCHSDICTRGLILLLARYRAIRIAAIDFTPIIGGRKWWTSSRPPVASTAMIFQGTSWCMCPSPYMHCPLPLSLTAIPYLHRNALHAHHRYSVLILTALTHRYSVLPLWTSAGDPAPSALQAPFPNSHPYP